MPHAQLSERASLAYRADIDGLRALAVVPVVFYHFHVAPFSGGYVGVDVFFVVSGFLITALIHAEMQTGEYSLAGFYERRARRILPALFAVLLATVMASLWWLFPADLKRFGESIAATSLFVSNFDFWQRAGYFAPAAETQPLLHTWSLAVEEQFYLLFPLLLALLRKIERRSLLLLAGGLALASFVFGIWAVRSHPQMAFYLAPSRIWELMLGAVLALGDFRRPAHWLAEGLSLLGLALLATAIFGFSQSTPIPGENAALPCLGAALLIYANATGDTIAARALSWRPIVLVGLVSYSLYLWHWPVYVLAHYASLLPLDAFATAALIALSGVLAVLSWRFIEQPFRGRRRFSGRGIFVLSAAGIAAGLLAGGALFFADGLPQRFSPQVQRILDAANDVDPRERLCSEASTAKVEAGFVCIIGDPHAKPSFALWGDSHAAALLTVVSSVAAKQGRAGYVLGHVGCAPLLDVTTTDEPTQRCPRINAAALALIARKSIRDVIVASRWAYYDSGRGTAADPRTERRLFDPVGGDAGGQHAIFARALERTVAKLGAGGRKVVLVADVPEIDYDVPATLARIALGATPIDIRTTRDAYRARQAFVARDFALLQQRYGVQVVEPAVVLCAADRCSVEEGGRPLYRDHHHLSVFGAMRLTGLFQKGF